PQTLQGKVKAEKAGYVQFINLAELVEIAEKEQAEIEVLVKIGDYVFEEKPIVKIHSSHSNKLDLKERILIGDERTAEQDLGYAVQKIVEVAIRATSPGRQDPNTANDILVRLGHVLGEMGHLMTDGLVLTDETGHNRLLYRFSSYSDILYKAFYQIVYHSKKDISVFIAMANSLIVAASIAPEMRHDA